MLSFTLLTRLLMASGFVASGPAVASITSATQTEGTALVHTVTLASAVTGTPGLYPFSIGGGTASTPSDYTATPTFSNGVTLSGATLTVPLAVSSFTITVATSQDTVYEGAEAYAVTVGGMSNTGSINDDDAAPTVASVSSASATEGDNIVHTVAITGTAQAARTFALTLSGGTATGGGTDYTSTLTNGAFSAGVTISAGNISVPPGVTSFTVSVPTATDVLTEGNETYTLAIGGASGTGTILDAGGAAPSFTVLFEALSNSTGSVLTNAFINVVTPPSFTVLFEALTNSTGTVATEAFINAASGSLITPSVTMSRTSGVAPLAVHFDATATTAPMYSGRAFHDLEYRWDFGDGNTTPWERGILPGAIPRNVAYGPVAAYVYTTAGTHTPSLQVRRRKSDGSFDTVTQAQPSVTVTDADVEFAGSKTICVSSSGDFTGAPAGCVQVTNANAVTGISGNIGAGNKRILFKRGETFDAGSQIVINRPGPGIVGAFGSGAKPIINRTSGVTLMEWGSSSTPDTVYDWCFQDLVLDGGSFAAAAVEGRGSCKQMLMYNCDVRNANFMWLFSGSTINGLNSSVPFTHAPWDEFYLVDSTFYNLIGASNSGSCTIFAGFDRFAMLGCDFDNNSSGEHGCRTQYTNRCVYSYNTIRNIQAGKANLSIRGGNFAGDNTYAAGLYSEKNVVSYNHFVGGNSGGIMGIGPQNSNNDERGRDMIVECNLYTGSASTLNINTCAQPDVTYRNNVALSQTGGVFCAIEKSGLVPIPTNVNFFNNTLFTSSTDAGTYFNFVSCTVEVGSGAPIAGEAGETAPAGSITVESRNNLVYGPGLVNVANLHYTTGAASFTTSNNTPDIKTSNPNFTVQPPTTIAHLKPTSGYAVGGGATGANRVHGRYVDILGVDIPATPDIGAVAA